MAKPIRLGTALTALGAIGLLSGCATPGSRLADGAAVAGKMDKSKIGLASRAIDALDKGDFATAIDFAERAVENSPSSAQFRALLGNAYFAGGRLASAEAAYRDSLSLQAGQAAVILKLALVSIGQGKNGEAIATLQAAQPVLDPADLGLALALAGRPSDAALLLDSAARQTGADARVRQNLALAHALNGDWAMARTIAEQDLAADQVETRLQQWMAFAKPTRPSDQLAALTGITPAASDPGQPMRLALRSEGPHLAENHAVPATPVVERATEQPVAPAVASEMPAIVVETAPASAEVAPLVADEPAPEVIVPAVAIAAAAPAFVPPAPMVRAASTPQESSDAAPNAPSRPAARLKPRRAAVAPARPGDPVVQLGAFTNRGNVESAWARFAAAYPSLRNYSPVTSRFNANGSIVYRLAVTGFGSGRQAQSYCASLKRAGAGCFVRASGGEQSIRLALR